MTCRRAALLGVLLLATHGDAAVLCRAGSGKLALREACRKAEQAVDPAEIDVSSLTGPSGEPGAPGPRGRHPIAIVDSAGAEVGTLLEIDGSGVLGFVTITHPALTETLLFVVSRDGFLPKRGGAFANVYYTSDGCAGVPFVSYFGTALKEAQVYGDSLYYPTGAVMNHAMKSSEADTGAPCTGGGAATARGTCCFNGSFSQAAAPAVRVPLASLGFVPPFRARPR
jgi:hypothetical protein